MELGTTTYEEGIAGGMEPGDAAQAAGQACMDAAADAGFPPDMIQACRMQVHKLLMIRWQMACLLVIV